MRFSSKRVKLICFIICTVPLSSLEAAFDRTASVFMRCAVVSDILSLGMSMSSSQLRGYHTRVTLSTPETQVSVSRAKNLDFSDDHGKYKWLPISHDADYSAYMHARSDLTFVPRFYTALTHLTGATDSDFDPFKGSFSFKFLLYVEKSGEISKYIYWPMQYRSFMRLYLYQQVPLKDSRQEGVYTPPTEYLFSKEDISEFSHKFSERLLTCLTTSGYTPKPFCIQAPSNLFISGYLDKKYFANHYADQDQYDSDLKLFEKYIEDWEEGQAEGARQVALRMLNKNLDIQLIQELTGLNEDEIRALQNETN